MDNDVLYEIKLSRAECIIGTKNYEVASIRRDCGIEFFSQGFWEIVCIRLSRDAILEFYNYNTFSVTKKTYFVCF